MSFVLVMLQCVQKRLGAILVEEAKKQGRGKTMVVALPLEAIKKGLVLDEIAQRLAGRSDAD